MDADFTVLLIFWTGVNALVGYLIGQRKNNVPLAIAISVLLGPIGWLIAFLERSNIRKCPYCAEDVSTDALICRFCGRDLPKALRALASKSASPPPPQPTPDEIKAQRARDNRVLLSVFGGIIGVVLVAVGVGYELQPTDKHSSRVVRPSGSVKFLQTGITTDQVTALLGRPTRIERLPSDLDESSEIWLYGNSQINFHQGRVTGWAEFADSPIKTVK